MTYAEASPAEWRVWVCAARDRKVLNHVSGSFGGIVGVYQRHEFEAEMRAALDAWAAHIAKIVRNQKPKNPPFRKNIGLTEK